MSPQASLGRGDVVLITFPFTDLSGQKLRPAVVVGQSHEGDLIVAFVTSRVGLPSTATQAPTEYLLQPSDTEFSRTEPKVPSSIRLDKIATLHQRLARRRLGGGGPQTKVAVGHCLRRVFDL